MGVFTSQESTDLPARHGQDHIIIVIVGRASNRSAIDHRSKKTSRSKGVRNLLDYRLERTHQHEGQVADNGIDGVFC